MIDYYFSMRKIRKCFVTFFFLFFLIFTVTSEISIQELEFRNQPLRDVIIALGEIGGVSMLPDDTITGNISYRFSNTTFDQILSILSRQYGLFFIDSGNRTLAVSRIKIDYEERSGLINLQANQAGTYAILQNLSRTIGKTILFDPMPTEELTFNSRNLTPSRFLTMLLTRFPEYTLIEDADYYYIKQTPVQSEPTAPDDISAVTRNGDYYSLALERGELHTVLAELFEKGDREYAVLFKSSAALRNMNYESRSFNELLSLLLTQSGGDFTISNGTYFIYDVNRQDILKKFKLTEYLPLVHISAGDIPSLLPAQLSSTSFYKIDKIRNGIIISGSIEETLPLKNYIISLDIPFTDREYYTFSLNYLEPAALIELLPDRLVTPPPLIAGNSGSFMALLTIDQKTEMEELISSLDIPLATHILTFRYLKAEDFLANIPPPFKADDFVSTGSEASVYFQGSEEKLGNLTEIVTELDTPKPQVRYKLLIIQYQESQGMNQELSVSNSIDTADSQTAFLGSIGNILSLDFDILSTFGYLFSVKLDYSISSSKANVLADTTLYGLSGETIRFQNSSTYRYQELEVDEEGSLKSTGVTQVISTGLFMDITGWVSGDDMITMEISSTLSKKGTVANSTESSLPPTSERVINTHIRTPSGEPIIIGGLMQTEQTTMIEKTPILGDIPVLGLLFRKKRVTEENTELVIYIVPYLDRGERDQYIPEEEINRIYSRFFPDGFEM